jgi:hypothetical protein
LHAAILGTKVVDDSYLYVITEDVTDQFQSFSRVHVSRNSNGAAHCMPNLTRPSDVEPEFMEEVPETVQPSILNNVISFLSA